MKCPRCQYNGSRVIDSRPIDNGERIRRRRECDHCSYRFTTFERLEEIPLLVVKKNDTREEFNREKILRGIRRACEKRPISAAEQENIVNSIERDFRDAGLKEIPSVVIGEKVMDYLLDLDDVAYIRFASVYRDFSDIGAFLDELQHLQNKEKPDNIAT